MKRTSYHDALIRAELDSHVLDCIDDLQAEGRTAAEAKIIAHERFGDITSVEQAVRAIDRPVFNTKFSPLTLASVGYATVAAVLYALIVSVATPLLNDYAQLALFWWAELGIIGITLIIDRWILQYTGLKRKTGAWAIILFTLLQNICLTAVLDIDHFEVVLHNAVIALLFSLIILFSWHRLSLTIRQLSSFFLSIITTIMVFTNQRLFEWLYREKCLFITPDSIAVTGCIQVPWFHPLLWPIYVILGLATGYLGYGLVRYWRNPSSLWQRKLLASGIIGALILVPWFVHDINNQAELDILPWKYQINQAYRDILGRNPESKDIEFYAASRAFEHMSKVRATLYQSPERKLKINQLYQQLLQREATTEEIQQHNQDQKSIGEIYFELSR